MRGKLLGSRDYDTSIHDAGAPLIRCVRFIGCTERAVFMPKGHNLNQLVVHYSYEGVKCLIYQMRST